MKNRKIALAFLLIVVGLTVLNTCPAFAAASTDVSGAVTSAYKTYMLPQIKDTIDNVVLPIVDIALLVGIIIKASLSAYSYKHNGNQFEWHLLAILFLGLVICLSAPNWIWNLIK